MCEYDHNNQNTWTDHFHQDFIGNHNHSNHLRLMRVQLIYGINDRSAIVWKTRVYCSDSRAKCIIHPSEFAFMNIHFNLDLKDDIILWWWCYLADQRQLSTVIRLIIFASHCYLTLRHLSLSYLLRMTQKNRTVMFFLLTCDLMALRKILLSDPIDTIIWNGIIKFNEIDRDEFSPTKSVYLFVFFFVSQLAENINKISLLYTMVNHNSL